MHRGPGQDALLAVDHVFNVHLRFGRALRVQVLNNHILTQKQNYKSYYPNLKYLIIEYIDPLGKGLALRARFTSGSLEVL